MYCMIQVPSRVVSLPVKALTTNHAVLFDGRFASVFPHKWKELLLLIIACYFENGHYNRRYIDGKGES